MFKSWTRTSAQDISVCLILKSENTSGGQKALAMAEGSVGVPQSSSRPSGMDSSLSAMHVLHLLLIRLCWQMLPPPHSLHCFLSRACWQMPAPPPSLQ